MKLCFLLSFVLAGLVSATHFKRVVHHHHHGLNRPQHQSSECHHSPTMTSTSGKPTNHPAMLKTNLEGAESTIEVAEEALVVFTPNRIKAGIAGGDSYAFMKDHIGWWYDWSPNPSKPGKPVAVPMLWGGGTADRQDAQRLKAFQQLRSTPPFVLGFEEPDCPSGGGSAGLSVSDGVAKWEALIAPLKAKGTKLGSPSMCKQIDETWLAEFQQRIRTKWDFTAIHINKNSIDGVKKVIEHYMKYGKPIWVTEFACVDDRNGFRPCTNQGQINQFIKDVVPYLQRHPAVYAYAYSNGIGLGEVWPLMKGGSLSESGKAYLAAIRQFV